MSKWFKKYKIVLLLLLFVSTLVIDLVSKQLVTDITITGEDIEVIPKLLTFTYSENTGASFGMFSDHTIYLTIFSVIVALGMAIYLFMAKRAHPLMQVSLVLFLSGALGNIYDRIALGYVRDFIDYTITKTLFNYQFAICNFADLVLFVGCTLMIVFMLFFYNKHYMLLEQEKAALKNNTILENSNADNSISNVESTISHKNVEKNDDKNVTNVVDDKSVVNKNVDVESVNKNVDKNIQNNSNENNIIDNKVIESNGNENNSK